MKITKVHTNWSYIEKLKFIIAIVGIVVIALGLGMCLVPYFNEMSVSSIPVPIVFIPTGFLLIMLALGRKLGFKYKEIALMNYESLTDAYEPKNLDAEIEDDEKTK